jgi:archaellum component FlaC
MGAKKKTVPSGEISDEDNASMMDMLRNMSSQLNGLTSRMDKLDSIESEVKTLRVLLNDLSNENKQLKAEAKTNERKLSEMNDRNNSLEDRLNSLEQHHRGWSARILNIPLTPEEETDNNKVRDVVYNIALLPLLEGAVSKHLLHTIPSAEQLLEVVHVLPGKPGQPKPVIMRFYNRNTRDICFRMKKFFAPRHVNGAGGGGASGATVRGGGAAANSSGAGAGGGGVSAGGFEGRGQYVYPLYEDLTRATFQKMRAISKDPRVKSCWTTKGQIKFILHKNEKEVKRVSSLLDTLDTILK